MRNLLYVVLIAIWIASAGASFVLAESSAELEILNYQDKYDEIIQKAPQLLQDDPENPRINLYLGKALCNTRRQVEALPYLLKATELAKEDLLVAGWARYYLSICYWFERDYARAKELLDQCQSMNTDRDVLDSAAMLYRVFGFDSSYQDWITMESEHFVFHFPNPTDVKDHEAFVRKHEETFLKVNNFFSSTMPRKVECFVYNSFDDIWKAQSIRAGFSYGGLCVIHLMYQQSPGHEMTHVIAYYYGDSINIVPLIGEGIAVYFDKTEVNLLELARSMMQARGIKEVAIKDLWSYWTSSAPNDVAYAIAGAFVRYLVEAEGEGKFRLLLTNQSYENAQAIYGERLEELIAGFEELLRGK